MFDAEVEAVFAPLRAAGKVDEVLKAEIAVHEAGDIVDATVALWWIEEIVSCFSDLESELPEATPAAIRPRAEGEVDVVTEDDVVAFSEAHEGDPLGDLAHGDWHPSTPASVASVLSMLAQELERRPVAR